MKCINQLKMLQKGFEHMNTHRQNLCMAARLMRQVYCNHSEYDEKVSDK